MFFIARSPVKKFIGHRCSSLYSVENILSEENIKRTIAKFANMKSIRLQPHQPAKKAAVLIPLCVVDRKVSLMYTIRTPSLTTQRGQVSFPGGMQDFRDDCLESTALRRVKEELGIHDHNIDIWGSGNLIVTRGEICLLPVIGCVHKNLKLHHLKINRKEIQEVFTVPIKDLCNPSCLGYTQFRGAYSAPVYTGGKHRIWGLTAIITNIFLTALLPQKAYKHEIRFISPLNLKKPAIRDVRGRP